MYKNVYLLSTLFSVSGFWGGEVIASVAAGNGVSPIAESGDLAADEATAGAEAAYRALRQANRSGAVCSAYFDAISHLLDCRPLTENEIARYILGNDPSPVAAPEKILFSVYKDGVNKGGGLKIIKKLIRVFAGLTQNGHWAALQEVIYECHGGHPFWTRFAGCIEFQEEIVRKVPMWLYIKFLSTPPIVEITPRSPEDAAREAVGIFEPWDIEKRYNLVSEWCRQEMEEQLFPPIKARRSKGGQ